MAEKGFGVKEINLIGASGTPTIESPNNLNLNAVNVAISTNVSVGGTLTVSGNLSIGGTITYEDVTNVDAVGIITAREGVFIPDNKRLHIGNTAGTGDIQIYHNTSNNNSFIDNITGDLTLRGGGGDIILNPVNNETAIYCIANDRVQLRFNNNTKLETSNTGVTVTGTLVATTFSGSGASLTSIPAGQLTGTVADARISTLTASKLTGALPAISGANLTNLNIPVNSEWSFGSTGISTTKNLGVNTTTVDNYETVGAANSFRGIYIGDGSLIFNARLDNPNGYYIGTGRNALNAGPITLGSTMTLDGAWVIV